MHTPKIKYNRETGNEFEKRALYSISCRAKNEKERKNCEFLSSVILELIVSSSFKTFNVHLTHETITLSCVFFMKIEFIRFLSGLCCDFIYLFTAE